MSEAAMMLLSGKPTAKGQGAVENARQGEAGTQPDGTAPPQLFGGLLLKMLNTEGEQAALQLPPAATAGEQSGNSLPSESPAIAWSALMVWDELPRTDGQAVLPTGGRPETMLSREAQAAASFLLRQANPLQANLQPGAQGEAMSQVAGGTFQNSDELFNQNLLKLLTEQSSNRVVDPRQSATLLTAPESTETGLNGSLSLNAGSSTSQQGQFNQLLAGLGGMNSAGGQRPEMQLPPMTVSPQHPNWSNGIGERIQWMVGQNMQKAEIRLEPPELGSLELRVTINRDQASLSITAANPQVRDAVEAAAPRLREMFGEVGLDLGDVNVSQESFAEQQQTGDNPDTQGQGLARGDEPGEDSESSADSGETRLNSSDNGLLDLYA
ncbi:MAG: flagellar hook-length control protein FliK [Thiohalophilus sp.]|uniref:flagellar hook-length control protein FliK n=1 Tax=Thiohalophilus sp. TaxID=3028392 RepID=UPI00286FE240|nr:flagellar hook-length control protein FliK [Thiohalophilus sp.]MDR9435747.1 flagellar hook-length control protein FliK [Thiohalophilus sp.]